MTKCYDLYFGSCGHIGVWCLSKCSYDVIVGEIRSESLCPSETCVVYIKRDVVGVRALGKSKCHSDTREPRPHNRISVTIYLNIGLMVCDMFPTPQPQNRQFMSPVRQVTMLRRSCLGCLAERSKAPDSRILGFFSSMSWSSQVS